jgi:hypothetical protein
MSNIYSVVMTGELVEGFELESVQNSFADIFKLSKEKVQNYFNGQPRILKKEVDHQTATKYKAKIERVGASVELHRITTNLNSEKILTEISKRKLEVKKTSVKNNSIKEAPTKQSPVKKASVNQAPVKQSTVKQSTVKDTPAKKVVVKNTVVNDDSINLIELGRIKKNQKMGTIELAEEPVNFWIMMFGFVFIIFGVADFVLSSLNVFSVMGEIYLEVASILVGAVFINSARNPS